MSSGRANEPVIACTLSTADDVTQRVEEWRLVLSKATTRERIDGGMRLRFPPGTATAGDLARLAALEVDCCGWLDFSIGVSAGATTLDVHSPEAGMDVVTSLFGTQH